MFSVDTKPETKGGAQETIRISGWTRALGKGGLLLTACGTDEKQAGVNMQCHPALQPLIDSESAKNDFRYTENLLRVAYPLT